MNIYTLSYIFMQDACGPVCSLPVFFRDKGCKNNNMGCKYLCSTPCRAAHNHSLHRMCVTAWLATLQSIYVFSYYLTTKPKKHQ